MQKTFNSFSFGCRVNTAETEALDRQLIKKGFQKNIHQPVLYIINTCAVTKKAEREARQMIYRLKKDLPKTKLVITGCAATKWLTEKNYPSEVDIIIDNFQKEYTASFIEKKLFKRTRLKQKSSNVAQSDTTEETTDKMLSSGRLLIKIQDGCQRFCTFCIVPYLRGQPKSASIKSIVKIIKTRPKNINEVILTAINTQAYGYDSKESLINLIDSILNETDVPRVSFGSIHPWSITSDFLAFYKKILPQKRLVNFFHIPLQSGSDKILSLMRRGYTAREFEEKLQLLAKINPQAFLATDIITGFLEESNKDFEDTYDFLKNSPLSRFHVFRFSPREKTAAYFMKKRLNNVTPAVKKRRSQALRKLSNLKYKKFLKRQLGRVSQALVLAEKSNGSNRLLLDNQLPAVLIKGNKKAADLINVKVESIKNGSLTAIPV